MAEQEHQVQMVISSTESRGPSGSSVVARKDLVIQKWVEIRMKTTYENILSAIPVSVMARYDQRYGNSWYVPWLFQQELAPILTVVVASYPGLLAQRLSLAVLTRGKSW